MFFRSLLLLCFPLFSWFFFSCRHSAPTTPAPETVTPVVPGYGAEKMQGLTMVAPPRPFPSNPMPPVQEVGGNWIAVVPYAYTMPGKPEVHYDQTDWQWWGETPEGARQTIRLAHQSGLKVMLKPQVYVPGGWTGALNFDDDAAWMRWEAGYSQYILDMARLAESEQAGLFCIGTEFNQAINARTAYWRQLINQIRSIYKGKLVYSANWDDWERVPFWDQLDYIGLGGYFPLVHADTPSVDSLKTAWKPICQRLKDFSAAQQKPVVFTEVGYLSVDNCGWRNWELEQDIQSRKVNQQAQANCYEAMLATFTPEPWWAGGFFWKWFPHGQGHEGYPERDYTPQGKAAESVLQRWWAK